jgi:hypothetical protein
LHSSQPLLAVANKVISFESLIRARPTAAVPVARDEFQFLALAFRPTAASLSMEIDDFNF